MWATIALLSLTSVGQAPNLGEWVKSFGPPSKSVEARDRVRSEAEPLMVYWMRTQAAPLGAGPALPGTLVANFTAEKDRNASPLLGFTFLAVASPAETTALVDALRTKGWIAKEQVVTRPGGRFNDLSVKMPDGRHGTVSVRMDAAAGKMADGRPSPTLWMYIQR
jgi:hypothetical protein